MVIDSDGFIIVTGYIRSETGADICVINILPPVTPYVQPYPGPGASEDKAYTTVDDLDNIYITGITRGLNNHSDIITLKYSPKRNFNGSRPSTELHGSDKGSVMCVDESNNIYVAGFTTGQNSLQEDYVIIKYNSAGVQQWFKHMTDRTQYRYCYRNCRK
jgi:hypothetical protein